jgi:putative sterol carrier protein
MPRFLTPAWVDAFNEAVAEVSLPVAGADAGLVAESGRFTVAQEVRGAPGGDVTLLLTAEEGRLRLTLAPAGGEGTAPADPEPNVTIALAYDDAVAMAKGELTPAEALTAGRVRVRGDLAVLVAGQQLLAEARGNTAALTAETTY